MKGSELLPFFLSCLSLGKQAQAVLLSPALPPPLVAALSVGPIGGNATFDQLIDHSNPSLGTFKQRYWWNTTYWNGPGSPVVLFTPGETEAGPYTGYLTNRTMIGQYAQEIGGATILFEHRYWGESTPYKVLDTKNLTYLTLENSIKDLEHFTKTVKLPFDELGRSNSQNAPWIFVGGSYSGALAAWTNKLAPDAFWAYHSSSAPVHAIYDYWSYFLPIYRGMPKNCSADLQLIAEHVDNVLDRNNETEIHLLKDLFGMSEIEHHDDFAIAVGSVPSLWQSISPSTNYSKFYKMCDSIEGVRPVEIQHANGTNSTTVPSSNSTAPRLNITVPATGIGLEKALANYASWFKHELLPDSCAETGYAEWNYTNSLGCWDSYNKSSIMFTDWAYDNQINRQWYWMLCNEPFGYWQTSAPTDQPTLMSRHVKPEYYQRQCDYFFPAQGNATYGSAKGKTADMLNKVTDGWDLTNTTRLAWVNGEFDPWRSASVSSEIRPGGPMKSTKEAPVFLMSNSVHCNDLTVRNAVNEDVAKTQGALVRLVRGWVDDFYRTVKGGRRSVKREWTA